MTERSLATMQGRFDLIFRIIAAAVIVVGIFLVLLPFLSALLVAAVLAIATWPLYQRIHSGLGGRSTWAASLMLLLILVLVVIPISLLAGAAADQLPTLVGVVKGWFSGGLQVLHHVRLIAGRVDRSLPGFPQFGVRLDDLADPNMGAGGRRLTGVDLRLHPPRPLLRL